MNEIKTLAEILNALQLHLKAPKNKQNTFANFAYRDASGILEAVKEELKKEEYPKNCHLTFEGHLEDHAGRVFWVCIARFNIGSEFIAGRGFAEIDGHLKGMTQAQVSGSIMSYAKKYALCNLFAIDDSKDDPDADENPKENDFKKLSRAISDAEIKGLKNQKKRDAAETFFQRAKQEFESDFGSLEEVDALEEKYTKQLESLKKYPDLYTLLEQTIYTAKLLEVA